MRLDLGTNDVSDVSFARTARTAEPEMNVNKSVFVVRPAGSTLPIYCRVAPLGYLSVRDSFFVCVGV